MDSESGTGGCTSINFELRVLALLVLTSAYEGHHDHEAWHIRFSFPPSFFRLLRTSNTNQLKELRTRMREIQIEFYVGKPGRTRTLRRHRSGYQYCIYIL